MLKINTIIMHFDQKKSVIYNILESYYTKFYFSSFMVDQTSYWLAQIKKWNKQVFADIYDMFIDDVYRFVSFRIDQRPDIEDTVSQVFYKAFCSLDSLNHNKFLSRLYTISRTTVVDFYRKKWTLTLEEALVVTQETTMIDRLNALTISESILAYIKTLWNDIYSVFDMRHSLWCSYKEISYINGKSESANKKIYSRLLKDLHVRFWKTFSCVLFYLFLFLWS